MNNTPKIEEVEQVGEDGIVVIFSDGTLGRYSAKLLSSIIQKQKPSDDLGRALYLLSEYCFCKMRASAERDEPPSESSHWSTLTSTT